MTLIEALNVITDLASENVLREDMIDDDEDDPLWAELAKQEEALALVEKLVTLLEKADDRSKRDL